MPGRILAPLLCGALLLSGCATGMAGRAATGALGSVDAAGIAGRFAARVGLAGAGGTGEPDLGHVGVPLPDLAAGRVDGPVPPDLVREALKEIAVEHGPGLAGQLAANMLTGGLVGAASLPSLAGDAADAARTLKAAAEEQAVVDAAYAEERRTRSETALVPDADRPSEAAALLGIADRQEPATARWTNVETGASGMVATAAGGGVPGVPASCRLVERRYEKGAFSRDGKGLICKQDGVWYDLG